MQQPPAYSPTPSNNNTEPWHAPQDGSNLLYTPKKEAFEPDSYSTPYLDRQVESKAENYRGFVEHAQSASGFASIAHREDTVHLSPSLPPRSHIYQPLSPSLHPSMTLAEHRVRFQPSHQTQFYSPAPVHLLSSPSMEFSTFFPQSLVPYQSRYSAEENLSEFSFAPAPSQWPYTPYQSSLAKAPIFLASSAISPLPESRFSPAPVQTSFLDLAPQATSSTVPTYPNLTTSEAYIPFTAQSIHHTDNTTSVVDSIPQSLVQAHERTFVSHQTKQKKRKFEQKDYKIKGKEAICVLEDMAESLIDGEIDPTRFPKPRKAADDSLSDQVSQKRIYHNQSTKNS